MGHIVLSIAARGLVELVAICLAYFFDRAIHAKIALFDPDGALADALDLFDGVRDKQYRCLLYTSPSPRD